MLKLIQTIIMSFALFPPIYYFYNQIRVVRVFDEKYKRFGVSYFNLKKLKTPYENEQIWEEFCTLKKNKKKITFNALMLTFLIVVLIVFVGILGTAQHGNLQNSTY